MTAVEVIRRLGLVPHPEGGCFRETWRAGEEVPAAALPPRYAAPRSLGTAIYYLLAGASRSALHRLRSDEVFHFYLGDPVELLLLPPGSAGAVAVLGPDLAAGMTPQLVVPRGVWQGARLAPGGAWALLGTTVAPGFDFADFELGAGAALAREFPAHAERIAALARA